MTTIINDEKPPIEKTTYVDQSSDSSGWAVTVIILLIVIAVGIYAWYKYHRTVYTPPNNSTNINVTVPNPTQNQPTGGSSGQPNGKY